MLLVTATWALLGVLCARYDLVISRTLVEPTAKWAALGERYGSLPGAYVLAVSAALLYLRAPAGAARSMPVQLALWCTSSICLATAVGVSAYRLLDHRFSVDEGLIAVSLAGSALFIARRRLEPGLKLSARVKRAAHWATVLGVSSWVVVHAAKTVWGRVRYRDLDHLATDFTPWYLPQGITGHASFPSGHTAMGWMLLPLVMLWPRGTVAARATALFGVCWGIFVALSRVVIGAHYASDVLFSTGLSATVMWFASRAQWQTSTTMPTQVKDAGAPDDLSSGPRESTG